MIEPAGYSSSTYSRVAWGVINPNGVSFSKIVSGNTSLLDSFDVSVNGNSVSWYAEGAKSSNFGFERQLNTDGVEYGFIAIGI